MNTTESKYALIESRTRKGQYDLNRTEAIIDRPELGRIYIAEGWGEMGLSGEQYRWEHGIAISIPAGESFAWLDAPSEWEVYGQDASRLQAIEGFCKVKGAEVLTWSGHVIAAIAKSAGA